MRNLLLALALALPAQAALPERPIGSRIGDFAAVLSPEGRSKLQALSAELEKNTGAELSVAVVPTLEGDDAADYSSRLFQAWGAGKKDWDNGILILLCPAEGKSRIEVGQGLAAVLPDALAGSILKEEMGPLFRVGKFEEGLLLGAARVSAAVGSGKTSAPTASSPPKRSGRAALAGWLAFGLLAACAGFFFARLRSAPPQA